MALENLNAQNFNEKVNSASIAIIDFWAPWCGPCRSFAPIFEKVAAENPDILFGKVNTEEEQQIAAEFQIRSIPTVMVIKEGVIVFNQAGMLPEDALKDIIKQVRELDMDMVRAEIAKQQQEQSAE